MPGRRLLDLASLRGTHDPPPWLTPFGSPEEIAAMPPVQRDQILFLDPPSTKAAYEAFARNDLLCGDDGLGNYPFRGGCFRRVEEHRVWDEAALKKWLYRRGIPFAAPVLVLPTFGPADDPAVLSTWKMVVRHARSLFGRDNLVVVGERTDWCLHYHHDDVIVFASDPDPAWRG